MDNRFQYGQPFTPPDDGHPEESQPEKKQDYTKEVGWIKMTLLVGLYLLLGTIALFFLYLAWVFIQAIGDQAQDIFRHIRMLFRQAPHMFRSPRGFGAFVELMLIAGFIGWVIRRFMKMR